MSKSHPEYDNPALGYCTYCQRSGVAAYRAPVLPFLPRATGRWHCSRCRADGPRVDARKPLAEWAAFDAAMRVQPRVVRGRHGRFETVAPVGGPDGTASTAAVESDAPGGNAS